eukprot:CAMPEP_0171771168 /NCGR_PEP_ID=MMETSP0991-20121206/53910_1 /TAXON_ID=483369 /ORGANISM="non described non described, Strain CCMP2098" /LENGTH=153 /DNA_ID=CAMNT_0012376409 /DNA_START=490 /DNA_END=948 /DNA_ORIENTATION=+
MHSTQSIRVLDLKLAIAAKKFSGEARDFDIQVQNAQTSEVYTKDDALVPKNTEVIVKRIPANANGKGLLQSALGATSRAGAAAVQAAAQQSSLSSYAASSSEINVGVGGGDHDIAEHLTSVGRTAAALAASSGVGLSDTGRGGNWRPGGKGKG